MVKLNHTITKIQFVAEVFFVFFTLSNLFLTYINLCVNMKFLTFFLDVNNQI